MANREEWRESILHRAERDFCLLFIAKPGSGCSVHRVGAKTFSGQRFVWREISLPTGTSLFMATLTNLQHESLALKGNLYQFITFFFSSSLKSSTTLAQLCTITRLLLKAPEFRGQEMQRAVCSHNSEGAFCAFIWGQPQKKCASAPWSKQLQWFLFRFKTLDCSTPAADVYDRPLYNEAHTDHCHLFDCFAENTVLLSSLPECFVLFCTLIKVKSWFKSTMSKYINTPKVNLRQHAKISQRCGLRRFVSVEINCIFKASWSKTSWQF